ncbi:MAG: hypothetical protein HKN32_09015, partial [Flavobacteriales bacterium]|nr:hypothetical protein [Flavobacteriales bacterium]
IPDNINVPNCHEYRIDRHNNKLTGGTSCDNPIDGLRLFSIGGRLIKEGHSLPIGEIDSGLYIVSIIKDGAIVFSDRIFIE